MATFAMPLPAEERYEECDVTNREQPPLAAAGQILLCAPHAALRFSLRVALP
jgi:hypothetical protein